MFEKKKNKAEIIFWIGIVLIFCVNLNLSISEWSNWMGKLTTGWAIFLTTAGIALIWSGAEISTKVDKIGKPLEIELLPKAEFQVMDVLGKKLIKIAMLDKETDTRFLSVYDSSRYSEDMVFEITERAKSDFLNLNPNKFFMEGDYVLKIGKPLKQTA